MLEFQKDPGHKSRLEDMKIQLKKLNQELSTINQDISRVNKLHQDVIDERNKGKYLKNELRWEKLFNISKLGINEKKLKFSGTIMTDGVAVSIIFDLVNEKNEINFSNTDQPVVRDRKKYEILKGLDPGLKLAFGGIERKMQKTFDINSMDSPLKITSKSF